MIRGAGVVAALLASLAFAQSTPVYLPFKMLNGAQDPFRYYIDNRTPAPGGLSLASVQSATNSAWNTWNALTCAVPKTSFAGFTGTTVPNVPDPYDTFNVTPVWIASQSDPYWQVMFGSAFVKGTAIPFTYAGVLTTCDIYLNGVGINWSVASPTLSGSVDLESVMLHETGHCLGLNHFGSQTFSGVMAGAVQEGYQLRQLSSLDVTGLCERNPIQGQIGSPCLTDGGCGSSVAGIKCINQPLASGSAKFCTVGCATGTGFVCDLPLFCEPATFFSPGKDGACLRAVNTVTRVGAPCNMDNQCGSSVGRCQPQDSQPSGVIRWNQGYCYQTCATGQPVCPAGSQCTALGGPAPVCLASCRVGLADCRPGYSCAQSINGGVCVPSCAQDIDCGDVVNFQCRICDGLCVNRQNSSGQIGDFCQQDTQCGAGQLCAKPEPLRPTKLCTISCGSGCGSCPTGSACHPLPPTNALSCLRTCTGSGTCPPGLRCASLSTGRACLGPCNNDDAMCPLGQECFDGDCYNFSEDAGCGAFCMQADSGKPIVVPKRDAGTGGGGSGGCGCATSSELAGLLAVGFVAWALGRKQRERAWRRS